MSDTTKFPDLLDPIMLQIDRRFSSRDPAQSKLYEFPYGVAPTGEHCMSSGYWSVSRIREQVLAKHALIYKAGLEIEFDRKRRRS